MERRQSIDPQKEIAPLGKSDLSLLRRIGGCVRTFFNWDGPPTAYEVNIAQSSKTDSKPKLQSPYPEPMRPSGSAYGSNLPFGADWRALLPEGDPDRPTDPRDFVTHDDPEYREVLRLLCQVPIDGVNNRGRRSY